MRAVMKNELEIFNGLFGMYETGNLEDLVYRLRHEREESENVKKPGKLRKFFNNLFKIVDIVFKYWSDAFGIAAAAFAAFAFAFAAVAEKYKKSALITSFISLCLSSISVWLSKGRPGMISFGLLFGFLIINLNHKPNCIWD